MYNNVIHKINQVFFGDKMCVTILFHRQFKDYPIILANNRDEMINRKFTFPQLLNKKPKIFGPKDLEKGGTWLGINEYGIVINILNKWSGKKKFFGSDKYISRGLLVLNLLKEKSIESIINILKNLELDKYLPFHLLVTNKNKAIVVLKDKEIKFYDISGKIFILGNLNPFEKWKKYEFGYKFINESKIKTPNDAIDTMKKLLKIHKGDKNIPSTDYAVKIGDFQTTSSSIVLLNKKVIFKFHNGFPGKSIYHNYIFEYSV